MNRIHAAQTVMILAALCSVGMPSEALAEEPYRQCAGIFFNAETSAWFAIDCLVPADYAQVGVLTTGLLPGVGRKKLWITEVYAQPKLTPSPSQSEPPKPVDEVSPVGVTENRAIIELVMPADAKLYVNDLPVEVAAGRNEVPISQLEPDTTYEYRLRLERDASSPVSERTIAFAAGDRVLVDLSTEPATDNVAKADDVNGSRVE